MKLDTRGAGLNSAAQPVVRRHLVADTASTRQTCGIVRNLPHDKMEVRPAEVERARHLFDSNDYPSDALVHRLSMLLAKNWPETCSTD